MSQSSCIFPCMSKMLQAEAVDQELNRNQRRAINAGATEVPYPDRVLGTQAVAAFLGVHAVTGWRMVRANELPPPFKIPGRKNGWQLSAITAWIESRPKANYGTGTTKAA